MKDYELYDKFTDVIMLLSEQQSITPEQALELFYESEREHYILPEGDS